MAAEAVAAVADGGDVAVEIEGGDVAVEIVEGAEAAQQRPAAAATRGAGPSSSSSTRSHEKTPAMPQDKRFPAPTLSVRRRQKSAAPPALTHELAEQLATADMARAQGRERSQIERDEHKDVLGMEEAWESGGTKDAPEGRMRHRREADHHSLVHELNEGHGENAHRHFDAAIGDVLRSHTRGSRHSTRSRESGSASTPRSGAPELPRATCLETVLDC